MNQQTTDYLDPDTEESIVNGLFVLTGVLGSAMHTNINDWIEH